MNGPTVSSQKANALIALYQLGGSSRELEPVLSKMRERGITSDIHNLAHLMWPLSKENLVTFLERKTGARQSSVLVNLSLTDRGKDRAQALLGIKTGNVRTINGRGRGTHAVGQDNTDFRRHADVAVGGPIERIKKEAPVITAATGHEAVRFIVLDETEAAHYRASSPSATRWPNQNEKPLTDVKKAEKSPEVPEKDAEVSPVSAEVFTSAPMTNTPTQYRESDTPGEYPDARSAVKFLPDHYPEIAAVLAKADKVSRFQRAAELLGDEEAELAVAILDKVKISPLEAEVIRLLG